METKIEQLRAKADLLMTTLSAHPKEEGTWQISVNFSSYSSLYSTVSDLMKLCTVALVSEEPYVSSLVGNSNIDWANIMELALQLLPKGEPEFLDEARSLLREEPQMTEEQVPEYNYSTLLILKKRGFVIFSFFGVKGMTAKKESRLQKILIPEIRKKLATLNNVPSEQLKNFLKENYFDLQYQTEPLAAPINLGLGRHCERNAL